MNRFSVGEFIENVRKMDKIGCDTSDKYYLAEALGMLVDYLTANPMEVDKLWQWGGLRVRDRTRRAKAKVLGTSTRRIHRPKHQVFIIKENDKLTTEQAALVAKGWASVVQE